MLLSFLLVIPLIGLFIISTCITYDISILNKGIKTTALITSVINLLCSLLIFILFDFSVNQFQFVQDYHQVSTYDFYLGVDGLSIYFLLLTTIIVPIALLSN
jgi:NADH:ubiquinone oxidoreductase subunit 4 (subunit M)